MNKCLVDINKLWKDDIIGSMEYRSENRGLLLKGKRGKLFCTFLMAAGVPSVSPPAPEARLHPAVIFCHGFPGNEENMDIAHALRRIGFHVMNFHYSGSWGSDGDFSFEHCIEDTESVLDLLLSDKSLNCDPDNIFIFGQSMGGFVTYHMLSRRPELKAGILAMPCDFGALALQSEQNDSIKQVMKDLLEEGAEWLKGTNGEKLYSEACSFAKNKTFFALAEKVINKPILVFGGSFDTLCKPETLITPWVERIRSLQTSELKIQYQEINTDHMFTDSRCTVTELVAKFLIDKI